MSSESQLYSEISEQVRQKVNKSDLDRASELLKRCDAAYRSIRAACLSPDEDAEAKAAIYDLIASADIAKLNRLFNSPINLLPADMKHSKKLAAESRKYFERRVADSANRHSTTQSPASQHFDSIDDFEAFESRLLSKQTPTNNLDDKTPSKEDHFELSEQMEQCARAMETLKSKFSLLDIPEIPNKLNENVHENLKKLGKIIDDFHKMSECSVETGARGQRLPELTGRPATAHTDKHIQEILCLVETLSSPTDCD